MESERDRVTVITSLCAIPNNFSTLNASGIVVRQQLLEDIMTLPLKLPLSHNLEGVVMAAIRKLKAQNETGCLLPTEQ